MPEETRIRQLINEEITRVFGTPLSIHALNALRSGGLILYGTVTLSSGSKTLSNSRIQGSSTPIVSYTSTTNPGTLHAGCTQGQLTVTSSSGTDASTVAYLIIL